MCTALGMSGLEPQAKTRACLHRCMRAGVCRGATWFRVSGCGFGIQRFGFRVNGLGFRVQGSGFRVQGVWFRVQDLKFRV